jgi:hypothetical protein
MRNHIFRTLLLGLALFALAACSNSGDSNNSSSGSSSDGSGQTLDFEGTSQNFINALFGEDFDVAKSMATAEYADLVSERVDLFAELLEKYEFREAKINTSRGWDKGTGTEETDKRIEIIFQFRDKDPDASWKIGSIIVRTLVTEGGSWGIGNLQLVRPKD